MHIAYTPAVATVPRLSSCNLQWNTHSVARILEALWAAGYRPAVYRQARLPAFFRRTADTPVFAELDPLALYDAAHPQHAQLRSLVWAPHLPQPAVMSSLLFLARTGGAWSPATHHHWPRALKQAARALLLCAAAGGPAAQGGQHAMLLAPAPPGGQQSSASGALRLLGGLPPDVLLHVLKLAAEPLTVWWSWQSPAF